MRSKACHNHRLIPKTKERKIEARKPCSVSYSDSAKLKNILSLI